MDVGAQPVSRLRGFTLSDAAIRRLVLVNAAALVVIVATGATVRLTGSGLGCEHWPGCTPHHFEPKSGHSYIEFGNRVIAFLTILTTLVTWIFARGRRRLAAVIFFGTLAQAPLGALTVHYHLNPWWVLSHFLLSMVVLTLAVVLAAESRPRASSSLPNWVPRVGLLVALSAGVLIFSGTLATAAGPHPGLVRARARVPRPQEGTAGARRARAAGAVRGADDDRRDPIPHAPAVVARPDARHGGCDGVGGSRLVRLQSLAPA
jgi:hypothetical protein